MPQWTRDQQEAIQNRGGTLLVSAAAGAGKTAVLVERMLRRLTDEKDPTDIGRLLLVTFTSAAAAEMRERIGTALGKAVSEDPKNKHLRKQLFLVHQAKITTVHAMCLRLAREQAAELGIAPDFRMLDGQEGEILQKETLDAVLETAYEKEEKGFSALCDLLSTGRDDENLAQVILDTYTKIQAHPDPRAFLERVREGLYSADMDTPHGHVLLQQATDAVEYGLSFLRQAVREASAFDELRDTYLPALTSDVHQAEELLNALRGGDWDTCVNAARSISFDRLKAARKFEDKALLKSIQAMREEWKTVAKDIQKKWLTITVEEAVSDRAQITPALSALIDMVNLFDEAFSAAKRARNAADFNDLEHFAIRLLYQNGERSKLARSLSLVYDEIAVDEYQDTNAVQDAIFRALSQDENNLFFVGDVKQSIYGFRLADPSIFLQKYQTFADADNAQTGQPRRVILGQNFRSRKSVLNICNYIFSAVMGETVGGLRYTEREALYPGAAYPEEGNPRYDTELLLIDAKEFAEEEDSPDKTRLEAQLVAARIRRLLDEKFPVTDKETGQLRPVTPDDIVVLLRATKNKADLYVTALEEMGITAATEERGGLLNTSEVCAVVSLLSVIDNPRQDVDLIGAMRSPMFGFTEQELADLRLADRESSFYDALLKAAETSPKAADFLQTLDALREFACDQPVYRLLWEIYDKTGVLGLYGALPNGAQRQENLLAFFERARAFEEQGFRGLFAFMRLLRGMRETKGDFQTVTTAAGGVVRVMSIHKSKGLEFPVVVLADCAKKFNDTDIKEAVLVDSELGFGAKYRDTKRALQYDTVERTAVTVRMRREMVSEELRILYVAMTRAREKLILTASSSSLAGSLKSWASLAALDELPQYAMGTARTPLAWIVTPLLRHPASKELRAAYGLDVPERAAGNCRLSIRLCTSEDISCSSAPEICAPETDTSERFELHPSFTYPNAFLENIPSKLTATGIGRGYRADEAAENTPAPQHERKLRAPLFERERPLSPSEIGTAHHLFMQFCDFTAASAPEGVLAELQRLTENAILSPQQAKAVDPGKISAFFASDLYKQLMSRSPVRREFKFSVLIPAEKYFPEAATVPEETVLLQGVIDCLIEQPEGFVILDFKTDRVGRAKLAARAEEYRAQLDAYTLAVEQIFDRPVSQRILYFFAAGQDIRL